MVKNNSECLICNRIQLIQQDKNPYCVTELKTGYVVIGDHQFFRGYTLFLGKKHVRELHELDPKTRKEFLWEMSIVAEAVYKAFKPEKLNYELLGNTDEHLHWHLFPRYATDPEPKKPVWAIDKHIRLAVSEKPTAQELAVLKETLAAQIALHNNTSPVR